MKTSQADYQIHIYIEILTKSEIPDTVICKSFHFQLLFFNKDWDDLVVTIIL